MATKVTSQEAKKRLKGSGLDFLEDYPGKTTTPWLLVCQICGKRTRESLTNIEKRSRPGCKSCCSQSQNRLSEKEALRRLKRHGLEAKGEYPGILRALWKVRCLKCGKDQSTSLATLSKRASKGKAGCTHCALTASREKNSVLSQSAGERVRKLSLEPMEDYPGHTKGKWKLRCNKCGTVIHNSLNQVESKHPCPNCRILEVKAELQNSAIRELKAANLLPLEPFPGLDKPWRSKCLKCRKETQPTLNRIRYQGSSCRHCAAAELSAKRLESSYPRALVQMRESGFEPIGKFAGFTRPWRARCLHCQRVSSPAPKWLSQGHGCRNCAKNAPWNKKKVAQVTKAAQRKLLEPFQAASTPILTECLRCGNRVRAALASLINSRGYCLRCKPSATWTEDKAIQMLANANMEPLEKFVSATTNWKSRCLTCGTIGSPKVTNIASGQGGCKVCGNYGYDIRKPTLLYVLLNRSRGVVKVGITNTGSTRLRTLAAAGFKPGKLYEFSEGSEPLRVETLLLRHFKKDLKLRPALKNSEMGSAGGASETFWLDELPIQLIHSRIRSLLRTED